VSAKPADPLRVLIVSHNCVGESNRRRVEALAALPGLDVSLLTPPWWFEEGNLIRVTQPRASGYSWRIGRTIATNNGTRHVYLSELFRLLRAWRPDVIDLHEEPFSLVALQTLLARDVFCPGAAFLFCSYVNILRTWRPPYRWVERYVLARADAAYAPNSDVPPILTTKGMRSPIRVIPSGVDVPRFASATPMDLPAVLSGATRPYVGFLGRLEPVKGLDYLVEAVARTQHPGTFVIAGDGPERSRLVDFVATHSLQERVRFLPGMPFAQVPGFIKALDGLVLPSITIPPEHKEQFGRVLTEAMAAGVPVVGSSSGAIPEVIGNAGLVVPERDVPSLAMALDRLLADPALRRRLANQGRARVDECFGWSVVARESFRLYEVALERRRTRQRGASAGLPARTPTGVEVPR
jgi:glycosyltransferase involved in cell wall biosynthesis